jgi:hypothetical protein
MSHSFSRSADVADHTRAIELNQIMGQQQIVLDDITIE